jgi:hypothetical protein
MKTVRRNKYRFKTLTKRGRRINVRTKKPQLVRAAAYNFARYHDFLVSANATPQGVTITRIS